MESILKYLASYFVDVRLEQQQSDFSGPLEVIYRNGRYALCTENTVYSYDDLYVNFRDSFKQININQFVIRKVLVLGLGLGSIPFLLEKNFKKKYHYTLVEIDPKIVNLAKQYTLRKLQSNYEVICLDAFEYMKNCSETFDLIAVDIFIDDNIPNSFESIEFLQNVKKALSPNALLMYNRLTYNEKLTARNKAFFENTFKKVFERGDMLSLEGNKMLLNKSIQ